MQTKLCTFSQQRGKEMFIFGNLIKKILIDKGISQKELASKCGITENNLSNILKRTNVNTDTMYKLADALDCDLKIELVPKGKP